MATGSLRFRTPHIEELPTTHTRQAPGFAWVAVSGPADDPSKSWGTTNRKRARGAGALQTESQKEATSARRLRETERKIKELNSDSGRDVNIPIPKRHEDDVGRGQGSARAGKTTNTKKILASGKTFAHYLDDEEAEIARTGRRDGDVEIQPAAPQRASKTPIARRKAAYAKDTVALSQSPAPADQSNHQSSTSFDIPDFSDAMEINHDLDDADTPLPPFPSRAEMAALLDAPPLTYNQARAGPAPAGVPPRKFCEICGYWGRVRCMKCGSMTCSVACKDVHDEHKCLKFYA